jgi:hypothetical protein
MKLCARLVNRQEGASGTAAQRPHSPDADLVRDPIALVLFPRAEAWASAVCAGRTYYFIGEATRAAFAIQNRLLGL